MKTSFEASRKFLTENQNCDLRGDYSTALESHPIKRQVEHFQHATFQTCSYLYTKQLLDEVFACDMQNYQCRGKSCRPAEGEADNSYRDIDNFAYHKNRVQ